MEEKLAAIIKYVLQICNKSISLISRSCTEFSVNHEYKKNHEYIIYHEYKKNPFALG